MAAIQNFAGLRGNSFKRTICSLSFVVVALCVIKVPNPEYSVLPPIPPPINFKKAKAQGK